MTRAPRKFGDTQPVMRDLAALEAEAAARRALPEDTVELPKARQPGTFASISSESAVLPLPESSPSVRLALRDRSNWLVLVVVLLGLSAILAVATYA